MKALRISLLYLTVAGTWIVASDYLLNLWWMPGSTWWVNTYKGWLFVTVTSALLFVLVRRAIQSIEASERRFRHAISDAPYPIMLHDSRGAVVSVNTAWTETTGYSPSEIVTVADWARCASGEHAKAESSRGNAGPDITEIRTKTGQVRAWKCTSASLGTQRDGTELFITLATDLTDQLQLECQLRQSQKMEAIGRLAGGIAHDFNNLLTIISGHAEVLKDDDMSSAAASESVREIESAATRAAALTRQLLLFSKRHVARPAIVDVNASVRSMDSMLRRLIGEHISVTLSISPETCTVEADPTNIEQVLLNLVVNAREAMPRGGSLAIETALVDPNSVKSHEPATIEPVPHVALTIRDSGTGMAAEIVEHVFEPFFTTKANGTGLGLSTVYGIVKQARGHIHVSSAPGEGTTIAVYMPRTAQRSTAEALTAAPPTTRANGGSEVVLVVEDDTAVRALIVRAVLAAGYKVLEAPDADAAVLLSSEYTDTIDLLITDMVMPGDSGARLADRLKKTRPTMKVIFISGYHEPQTEHQQYAGPLVPKPFSPDALMRAVRQVLDGASESR